MAKNILLFADGTGNGGWPVARRKPHECLQAPPRDSVRPGFDHRSDEATGVLHTWHWHSRAWQERPGPRLRPSDVRWRADQANHRWLRGDRERLASGRSHLSLWLRSRGLHGSVPRARARTFRHTDARRRGPGTKPPACRSSSYLQEGSPRSFLLRI